MVPVPDVPGGAAQGRSTQEPGTRITRTMMKWISGQWMLPPQGWEFAKEIDFVYLALFWLSVVLFLMITIPAIYFAWKYRYKPGRVTPHQTHNTVLEVTWSVLPLILCIGIFFWGLFGYLKIVVAPG